jgi:hypothetical protein
MKTLTLMVALVISSFSFAQVTNGLIAKYSFSGNANDDVGSNNGTVNGASLAYDRFGNPNNAYSFDGNDNIEISSANLGSLSEAAVSIWIKPEAASGSAGISSIFSSGYWVLYINRFTTKKLLAAFDGNSTNNSSSDETSVVTYAQWIHVVLQNDGSTTKVYINGALEASYAETFAWVNSQDVTIGGRNSAQYYYGYADDLRIYDRALDSLEIDTLFNLTESGSFPRKKPATFEVESKAINSSLEVYPNPSNGLFYYTAAVADQNANVQLFNLTGELLFSKNELLTSSSSIDLQAYPVGTYILKVTTDEKTYTSKLIKQE